MLTVLMSLALTLAPLGPQPTAPLVVTPSTPVLELDLRRLDGPLVRQLAWSPDQTELYLQTYEANRDASVKQTFHYLLSVRGGAPKPLDVPPGWAVAYQNWKANQSSPDDPSWKIEVSTEKKIQSATSIPMGGDLARGGTVNPTGGLGVESAASAAVQSTNTNVYTMRLGREVVGEWINHPIVPGLTFGWAPPGRAAVAFAARDGRLAVLQREGVVRTVDGTKDVTLPSWSPDGTRIAYLQKSGRSTYTLHIATVTAAR